MRMIAAVARSMARTVVHRQAIGLDPMARVHAPWIKLVAWGLAWFVALVVGHRLMHVNSSGLAQLQAAVGAQMALAAALAVAGVVLAVLARPSTSPPGLRLLAGLLIWGALLVLALALSHVDIGAMQALLRTLRAEVGPWSLALLAVAYAIAMAIPFVPGMKLGMLIMVAFGPLGVLVAYAATIAGLCMAYATGRLLPALSMPAHANAGQAANPPSFLALGQGPGWRLKVSRWLLSRRHLALAVALNMPGNSVVGGGGGIGLLCGMSRQFGWCGYLLTVAIAISPVPILMLSGLLNLELPFDDRHHLCDALTWLGGLAGILPGFGPRS